MRFPKPDRQRYLNFTVTIILIHAIFQYTGVIFGSAGQLDWLYLVALVFAVPALIYLTTLLGVNIEWLPRWDEMIETSEPHEQPSEEHPDGTD